MTFGVPLALWWLLGAAPIVVLYILKVRQRRVPVPTLLFWRQVFEEKQPRSIWQRLRHLLSLLAQLLMLALLAFALAQPVLPWQVFKARQLVLILDNSASMSGRNGERTRLDEAKRKARAIVDGMRFFDSMAVLTAGGDVAVSCGMTDHQRTLRERIDAIEATTHAGEIAQAVTVARKLLEGKEHALILVVTDHPLDPSAQSHQGSETPLPPREGQGEGGAPELPANPSRETSTPSAQASTLPQPLPAKQGSEEQLIVVPVAGDEDNVAITRLAVRRSLIDPIGYEILAHVTNFGRAKVDCRLEMTLAGNLLDVYPLALEPGRTWTHVFEKTSAEGGELKGVIDRPDALLLDNAASATLPVRTPHRVVLHAAENIFVRRVLEAIPLVQLELEGSLHVYLHEAPATLPPGNAIVIDPRNATNLWDLGETLENPLVTKQETTSSLMAHVRLDNVLMPAARKLTPRGPAKVLAESLTGEPIYLAFERETGKTLVLTADLDQSDLPLRTAFPIMMTNALNWFANEGGELQIASNPTPASESDLKQPPGWTETDVSVATAGLTGRPAWFYLLVFAVLFTALEWCLYQRRHIR